MRPGTTGPKPPARHGRTRRKDKARPWADTRVRDRRTIRTARSLASTPTTPSPPTSGGGAHRWTSTAGTSPSGPFLGAGEGDGLDDSELAGKGRHTGGWDR